MYGFEYYRPDILRTESGGDYNALFGYQNRPGGRFQNVRVTDMTIGDILEFQNPRGAYGQYVAGARPDRERGVATPVGAYQIVGTTLRDAVRALNLPLDTTFTPDVQDRIAKYIFETQGPQAWQGLNINETAGQNVARATMAALGRGDAMNGQPTTPGLLAQGQGPQRQPFFQRPETRDLLDQLAIGFAGMSLRPNQGIIDLAQSRIEQRQTRQQRNATADWLESQGLGAFAEGVRQGSITASDALTMARGPEATSAQRNYEFLLAQGVPQDQALQRAFSGGNIINVGGQPTTPGWEAIDKAYADTWLRDSVSGITDAASQAATISTILGQLEAGQQLTGPLVGAQPDFVRAILNPTAQDAKDRVEQVVQRSLRETLGAQFTQAEGDRLIARAYNPSLPPQANAARLRALFTQLEAVNQQKLAMRQFFNEKGTLQGFSGPISIPTIDDFIAAMDAATDSERPSGGTQINGVIVGDPY